MSRLCRRWDAPSLFGDAIVLGFVVIQGLDGVFTYLGVSTWGLGVEANPIIASAVSRVGLGTGLLTAKLIATAFGILLHLFRVHNLLALLTIIYFVLAILPWTAAFIVASR